MSEKIIIDAKADSEGNIAYVKFKDNERFTSVERAIKMADKGDIANAHAVRASNKKPHLRSNPDRNSKNNLDYMAGEF